MENSNIIMINLDGLRRDRLRLCKTLSALSEKGCFFSNMITAAPYTIGSVHAIFSGVYPTRNGVDSFYNMFKFKKDKFKVLTQYFKYKGYHTISNSLTNCAVPLFGFDEATFHENKINFEEEHKELITEAAKKGKFFLYLQYTGMHREVIKHIAKKYDDFNEKYFGDIKRNRKLYNSFVLLGDKYVDVVYKHIKELGIANKTMLILFSDHGTSNGEKRGERMYGSFTYDYTINTFAIMIIPGIEPKEVNLQCNSIDIMPTLMDILDIEQDKNYESLDGKSLMPMLEGEEEEDRIAFSETGGLFGFWPSHKEHNVFCIKGKIFKLIYNKTPDTWEFYNLKEDLNEENNLYEKATEKKDYLKRKLINHMIEIGVKDIEHLKEGI